MIASDFLSLTLWWAYLFLIGIAFFPISKWLFSGFLDKGYVFAKTIGIVLLTYSVMFLGFFQLAHLTALLVVILLLFFAFIFYRENITSKNGKMIIENKAFHDFSKYWKILLVEEILFFLALFFLAYIRSFSPDIHGLEKYMDFGFMNSILRSETFPPKDMWLAPFSINYYYFGHYYSAVLMRLTNISPYIAYNLILATVFALAFTGSFAIGSTLYCIAKAKDIFKIKHFLTGLLTASLVTLSGNLHVLYAFFTPYPNEDPVPFLARKCLKELQGSCVEWGAEITRFSPLTFPNSYWYPNATRFIHNTIHEFPMYSWIVADLHGHVLDIPFVILTIGLLLTFFLHVKGERKETTLLSRVDILGTKLFSLPKVIFLSMLLGVMYMTNAWDGIIYFLLATITFGVAIIVSSEKMSIWSLFSFIKTRVFLVPFLTTSIVTFIGFLIFSLPFSLFFKPFVSGVGVLCAPNFLFKQITSADTISYEANHIGPFLFEPNHCTHSPLWQLIILYGFFFFFIFLFLLLFRRVAKKTSADYFVLCLIILGVLLIIIPEFIYVKDIYPDHYRANTMFKLVFQAFILLSIASAYTVVTYVSNMKVYAKTALKKGIFSLCLLLITVSLSVVLIYPFLGIQSYYGNLTTYSGLDGLTYLKNQYPNDYEAILWIQKNIKGQPVILEAQGDSYTDYARVSANTGLITVLGWTVHEWLWRGSYGLPEGEVADPNKIYEVPAPRIEEVQNLYETDDLQTAMDLIKKYNISLIFIGDLEKQKYPKLQEHKFGRIGKMIYQKGTTKIYRISNT